MSIDRKTRKRGRGAAFWRTAALACFLMLISRVFAQDVHYSQFYANPLYLNPASTGAIDGVFRVGINQKTQWLSVTKPFVSFAGSFDAPVYKSNGRRQLLGLGAQFSTDRAGDSRYQSLQGTLSVSFTKALDRRNQHKLGIGVYGGFIQRSINYGALTFDEQYQGGVFSAGNPVSESFGRERTARFDLGAGIAWSYTPNRKNAYSIGFSASHLLEPDISFSAERDLLHRKYTAYFTSRITLLDNFSMSPVLYAAFQHRYREILFGSQFEYQYYRNAHSNRLAAGGGLYYRWKDALIICGTVQWENIRVGLSYDLNFSSLTRASHARGGFEASLYYIFKKNKKSKAGHEPCPYEVM